MNRSEKIRLVEQLRADLGAVKHLVLAEYRGMSVEEMTEFRNRVRGAAGGVRVVKNTLLRRAVEGTEKADLLDLLEGPNAMVLGYEDPVELVKAVAEAAKGMEALTMKGGFVEGQRVSAEDLQRVAALPSRAELLGRMVGSLASPLRGLLNVCTGTTRNLVYAVEAIRQVKASGAEAA